MLRAAKSLQSAASGFKRVVEPTGARSLGIAPRNPVELAKLVLRGLPYPALARFHKTSGLSVAQVAKLTGLAARTLVPVEFNFLLNPLHRDSGKLVIGSPRRIASTHG